MRNVNNNRAQSRFQKRSQDRALGRRQLKKAIRPDLVRLLPEDLGSSSLLDASIRPQPILPSAKAIGYGCIRSSSFKIGTELNLLVAGNAALLKDEQDMRLQEGYEEQYELD